MTTAPRRVTDRIILYGSIAGALATIFGVLTYTASAYSRYAAAVDLAPKTAARVDVVDSKLESLDERLWIIEWWVTEMGKKAGVSAPPRRRRSG